MSNEQDELRDYFIANYGESRPEFEKDLDELIAQHTKEAVERGALRARKQGYDPNFLGSWIFIGDNEQLNNLDDLYWSYVTEFCVKQDPYRIDTPYADTERWKRMMPSASFGSVGEFKMLASADQYAKERIAELAVQKRKDGAE